MPIAQLHIMSFENVLIRISVVGRTGAVLSYALVSERLPDSRWLRPARALHGAVEPFQIPAALHSAAGASGVTALRPDQAGPRMVPRCADCHSRAADRRPRRHHREAHIEGPG